MDGTDSADEYPINIRGMNLSEIAEKLDWALRQKTL